MSFWYDENFQGITRLGLRATESLFEGKSEFQKIDVVQTKAFGRVLAIDEIFMTSEKDEYFYHEMLVHPPMTTAKNIRRVLVIGGGDGGTVREVLTYPEVEQVTMVEIDPMVVEISKRYLSTIGTAWDDPRLIVQFGDGIDFAKNAQVEPFDVILLDGSDPVGPAEGLFTKEFYQGCARLLAEDGVFCLQSESPILQKDIFLELARTLGQIFERVHPYFGPVPIYASGTWSWTYATRTGDPGAIKEDRIIAQEKRCKYFNREIHKAAYALPNNLKQIFKNGKVE